MASIFWKIPLQKSYADFSTSSTDERRKSDKASREQGARFPESGNQAQTVLHTKARKVNTDGKAVRRCRSGQRWRSYRSAFHTGAYSSRIWKREGVSKSQSESLWVFHDSRIRLCFCSVTIHTSFQVFGRTYPPQKAHYSGKNESGSDFLSFWEVAPKPSKI